VAKVGVVHSIDDERVTIRLREKSLIGVSRFVPISEWTSHADKSLLPAISEILSHTDDEDVMATLDSIALPHERVAILDGPTSAALGLPPAIPMTLDIRSEGAFTDSDFMLRARWVDRNYQAVPGLRRVGGFLNQAGRRYRIPEPIFSLVVAIDRFNARDHADPDDRLKAWAWIQKFLRIENRNDVFADGHVLETRVAHAAAFSLALKTENGEFDFQPILFGKEELQDSTRDELHAGADAEEPILTEASQLLPPAQQSFFVESRFLQGEKCRGHYALSDNWYVVLDEPVRRALDVVRKVKRADSQTRREFVRNPRAFLRETLGALEDHDFIDSIFVETAEYSSRVIDIGIWEKSVLPWVQRESDKWLPEKFGIRIENATIFLDQGEISELKTSIETAMSSAAPAVNWKGHVVPATSQTVAALNSLIDLIRPEIANDPSAPPDVTPEEGGSEATESSGPIVLIVDNNFEQVGITRTLTPRLGGSEAALPASLITPLKSHQTDGVRWLQMAWRAGQGGVLLADDMGLGKTLQALAFLAWLREGMAEKFISRRPILVVAPTGLLKNWEQEHDLHLRGHGLGNCVRAYGSGLRSLRSSSEREIIIGRSVLDSDQLREADWVLTTYETLRDYQHSFGSIRFAAIVFDEMQKIKTPNVSTTVAAKAMNGEFKIGLTGTPIENRLADLWCIVDTLEPGYLGDLKSFSSTYEANADPELLINLKRKLETGNKQLASLMLRRMKDQVLEGLPSKTLKVFRREMPGVQASAYNDAVLEAQSRQGPGKMLKALHVLKSISLHPIHPEQATFPDYIRQSARIDALIEILDKVKEKEEKALIFVESLDMHPVLAGFIQRRYALNHLPMIISGEVTGPKRQKRVNEFQSSTNKFDIMILSPRAGGVGLTLTAANHVIHLSRWWNPAIEDQCTDRIFRIGQDQDVHVYYLIATHPDFADSSFDERLHSLLERKRALSREMLLPPVDVSQDTQTLFNETIFETEIRDGFEDISQKEPDWSRDIQLEDIDAMAPLDFENWCLRRLQDRGFLVHKTPTAWDCGADGIAENPNTGFTIIIQCKHIQTGQACTEEAVNDLIRARAAYKKETAVLHAITNAPKFSASAVKIAAREGIVLIDRNSLRTWPSI